MNNDNSIFGLLLPYQKKFFLNKKKRKIFIASRQCGKSFVAATILVWKCLSKQFGTSICISVNQNSASEIIKKCIQVAEAVKLLTKGKLTYQASFDKIVFSNGSRVISLSSNPSGIRGYTACCCVIDEAAFIEHLDKIMQAIGPTLTRDPTAELLLLTTPAGRNGHFYKMYEQALNEPKTWYVQHTTIYDAMDDGLNVDIESLKSLCPDDAIFKQEYCCEFANSNIALLNPSKIQTFNNIDSNYRYDYFIGVDFGRTNDYTAICVLARDINGINYLIDITVLKDTEFAVQMEYIKNKFNQYHPKALYCDAGGLGKPLAEELELHFNRRCKGFIFNQNNKHDAYMYFKKMVTTNELLVHEDYIEDIKLDINNVSQVISDSGKVSYLVKRGRENGHNDRLSALILALQASRDNLFINVSMPITYKIPSKF